MGAILLGIILLLVGWLVPLPYPLGLILVIIGICLIVYGIWIIIPRGPVGPDQRRRAVRWY